MFRIIIKIICIFLSIGTLYTHIFYLIKVSKAQRDIGILEKKFTELTRQYSIKKLAFQDKVDYKIIKGRAEERLDMVEKEIEYIKLEPNSKLQEKLREVEAEKRLLDY